MDPNTRALASVSTRRCLLQLAVRQYRRRRSPQGRIVDAGTMLRPAHAITYSRRQQRRTGTAMLLLLGRRLSVRRQKEQGTHGVPSRSRLSPRSRRLSQQHGFRFRPSALRKRRPSMIWQREACGFKFHPTGTPSPGGSRSKKKVAVGPARDDRPTWACMHGRTSCSCLWVPTSSSEAANASTSGN